MPNAVIAPVSATGTVCFYVYGTAHLLADVSGYFPTGSDFTLVDPGAGARHPCHRQGRQRYPAARAPLEDCRVFGKGGLPASRCRCGRR